MANWIEFDRDDENKKHLGAHKVTAAEFEEERYRSVGLTNRGRLLSVAWTIRNGKVRAIAAFPASLSYKKAFLEKPK